MNYGTYCSRIDEKLRILIPSNVRSCIDTQTLVVCLDANQQLKLLAHETLQNASEAVFELCTITLDSQSRISIPRCTRDIFPELFKGFAKKQKTYFHVSVTGIFMYFTQADLMQSVARKTSA